MRWAPDAEWGHWSGLKTRCSSRRALLIAVVWGAVILGLTVGSVHLRLAHARSSAIITLLGVGIAIQALMAAGIVVVRLG